MGDHRLWAGLNQTNPLAQFFLLFDKEANWLGQMAGASERNQDI